MAGFEIDGNGKISGVGSGNPSDMSSFQQSRKKSWHSKCLAIIQPETKEAGKISLTAGAEGLDGVTIVITTKYEVKMDKFLA